MAFTVQNEDGTVEGANAYVTVEQVRAYWTDRGLDLATYTDPQLEAAIVKATSYLDSRYTFKGYQMYRLQGTQWPRGNTGRSFLRGLPPALINAACSLAQRALTKNLFVDPSLDPSGQVVTEVTKKVGPIETSKKFASATSAMATTSPQFPEITLMLRAAGMLDSSNSGQVYRG